MVYFVAPMCYTYVRHRIRKAWEEPIRLVRVDNGTQRYVYELC